MSWSTEKLSAPALGTAVGRGGGEGGEVHVERIRHLVHGRALGIGVNVGVDVQRHAHARMPQVARPSPHVASARDHHGGEGVPEVVEGALEAVYLAEGGEVLAELRGVVGPALLFLRA